MYVFATNQFEAKNAVAEVNHLQIFFKYSIKT